MGSANIAFMLFLLPSLLSAQGHFSFHFNQFNASTLKLFGDASVQSNAISLNGKFQYSVGRAFYGDHVRMKYRGSPNSALSFSTTFVFSVVPSSDTLSGHGLAFIMTPHRFPEGLIGAEYLGLLSNLSSVGEASNHLFAVEFDTIKNEEFLDIDGNHVGVDLNDLTSVNSKSAGYWIGNNQFQNVNLKSGQNLQAWIDYDNLLNELNVTITEAGLNRPGKPLIHIKNMSLSNIFEEEMYVGFSAATGSVFDGTYILGWSFTTNGAAPFLNTSNLPSFAQRKLKSSNSTLIAGVSTACVLLILLVVVASVFRMKRNRYSDIIEEWEKEYWPQRLDYKDLHIATKGFGGEELLGSGGFGKVYKGVLPTNGLQVAVKCILRETYDGVKEFIAELSSLGRLQHRNLVQIRGFCRLGKKLFIVYDYMPNGSLDKKIFGNPNIVLGWNQRYRVLMDVAAGLLYLHEEWEQCVVHRDIKSSNVLLDSELNGKLGDFGLARLYEHNENSQTTRVVGTLGYIAPELIHTGKASPATDVFSFGIFLLEVACGRRPVDPSLQLSQVVLVDWVRELHANGSLMDAADPNLLGEYVEAEMERVLKLGLFCSNPQPEGRLGMRQVLQILEEESPIPALDDLFYVEMSGPSSTWNSPPYFSHSTDASIFMSLDRQHTLHN
ncbi:L-type lectin-domain containing receptor kinase SIT2-like [Cryptomeria japonica]|uniref:L-type lectin-domain containing receptor kinase SIT2-like n=1 Tax=Cryptomeria japonica TaxID=3369 RepID=UPI0025AB96A4|nr:L-type lectin-domain containing receptor kinase SIT2-like [Cryptomeria japonica]XP_057819602.1 L-type lectin-domain containing receptor kinase SIT2-like [Cryptomeria japonica]